MLCSSSPSIINFNSCDKNWLDFRHFQLNHVPNNSFDRPPIHPAIETSNFFYLQYKFPNE